MEKNDNWFIQLRKGVFEVAILSLISKKAKYGYEITSELNKIPAFQLPNGSIYPILGRLTKNGWALSYWEDSIDGPKRKYYEITTKGNDILKERLEGYKTIYDSILSLSKGESTFG
jgi:PadR family transcriptional regulator, regulatory protein PadR